ncbi:MAG: hypothetical protein O3A00_22875 [Planctomycetota bacterium]|nr:hypothetical protein [Planctomycetota bacterium]
MFQRVRHHIAPASPSPAVRRVRVLKVCVLLGMLLVPVRAHAQVTLDPIETPQPLSGSGAIATDTFGLNTHLWAAFDGGEGPFNGASYATLGFFTPRSNLVSNLGNEVVTYIDGRVAVQDRGGMTVNAAYGARIYQQEIDRVFGVHARYTGDNTRRNYFQQVGVGVETFGDIIDANANGYLPFGDKGRPYGNTGFVGLPIFGGNTLLLPQYNLEEQAMFGFDAEIGSRIPGLPRELDARIWGGYYFFDSDDVDAINGIRGRVEARVNPQLLVHVTVTSDNRFNTHVMAGVVWDFTKILAAPAPPTTTNRASLGRLSRYNQNVMVAETSVYTPIPAIDPATGLPFRVVHVNSGATPGGDGTIEAPLNSLTQAGAVSQSGDIVYLHRASVFDGQSFVMQDNQRLLGEGGNYTINTQQLGNVPLPKATLGGARPLIRNSAGAAVTLANAVEVAGIGIETSTGAGFLADGISGSVLMTDNTIDGSFRGLDLRNSSGTFTINNTPISNTTDDSIVLEENTSAATFAFGGTTSVNNPGGIGVSVQGGEATITFADVNITNRNSTAIGIGRAGGTITFSNPMTLDNPNGSLTEAIGIANGTGTVNFSDVTITDTNRVAAGLPQVIMGNNSNTTIFDSLNITTTNGGGISALNVGTVTINGGSVSASGGAGVIFNGVNALSAMFRSVSASNTADGIHVINSNGNVNITGDGATPGSGGTLNVTDTGIAVRAAQNVLFNYMDITAGGFGLRSHNSDNVVLNSSTITGNSLGFVGVRVTNDNTENIGSPVVLSSNTINITGDDTFGIWATNNASPQGSIRIDDHSISLTGNNTTGIFIQTIGTGPASGPGDIVLLSLQNNSVISTPGLEFTDSQTDSTIFGQILVNGLLVP